jgi:hypothetical protein
MHQRPICSSAKANFPLFHNRSNTAADKKLGSIPENSNAIPVPSAYAALSQVAGTSLDRKRSFGGYAVICLGGKAIAIGEDTPTDLALTKDSELGLIRRNQTLEPINKIVRVDF